MIIIKHSREGFVEMKSSRTYIATPPGATVKEQLQYRKMSQKEFAKRMDMSEKHISKFLNGDVALTPDMASRLEMVLGLPAHFWNNLESIYREKLQLVKEENEMEEDEDLLKKYPYSKIEKFGWVKSTKDKTTRVFELRKLFEVVKLSLVNDSLIPGIVYRRQSISEKSYYSLITWAQRAKIEARDIETKPINLCLLEQYIPEIRTMTRKSPEEFCPKLISMLSECGIALVLLPHIDGSYLHGATFYDKDKIVIGLTARGKDADKFWFSLLHEIGHVVLGHINIQTGTTEKEEDEADNFAQNTLIPQDEFCGFIEDKIFTKASIKKFSEKLEIDEGIVVGRLQKEGLIPFSKYNEMKTRYVISN